MRHLLPLLLLLLVAPASAQTLVYRLDGQQTSGTTLTADPSGTVTTAAAVVGGNNLSTLSEASGLGTRLTRRVHLNGSTDYVTFADLSAQLGTNNSWCVWIWLDNSTPSNPSQTGLINMGPAGSGGATHYPYSDGNLYLSPGRYTTASTPNRWTTTSAQNRALGHHLAMTNTSGANGCKLWINGVNVQSTTGTTTPYWTGSTWTLGRSQDNIPNLYMLDGSWADFRVYSSTLDSTMLTSIMAEKDLPVSSFIPQAIFITQRLDRMKLQADSLATYGVYALAP